MLQIVTKELPVVATDVTNITIAVTCRSVRYNTLRRTRYLLSHTKKGTLNRPASAMTISWLSLRI